MTVSVREQVLTAFEALLAGLVPGITVFRARRKELPEGKFPVAVMRGEVAGSEQQSAAHVVNIERVTVALVTDDRTDAGLDRALVDLGAKLQRALEQDPTLGGVAVDTNPADFNQVAADDQGIGGIGQVIAVYLVEYWTKPGDPYAAAP